VTAFIALLRAVNVGGTGKLSMPDLRALCEAAGFQKVRTYIASGNVVFEAVGEEASIKSELEEALKRHMGKPVGVMVRTGAEMAAVLAANPFASAPPNRTVAVFLDQPPPADPSAGATGHAGEEIAAGTREIYIHYGEGMAHSKLRIPAAATGTARNMNTVAKLAALAGC
jgi:uncharacterized protein (DUF1697 family)